jgi:DNA invertase Pin-like site-specific DNA recombinase
VTPSTVDARLEQPSVFSLSLSGGYHRSRRPALDESKAALAQRMRASGEAATTIAKALRASRATLYRVLADQAD